MLRDNGKIVTEDEIKENEMPPLEDVEDKKYIARGELNLVVRRALSVQVKKIKQCSGKTFSILGAMFKIKYVV